MDLSIFSMLQFIAIILIDAQNVLFFATGGLAQVDFIFT